MYYTVYQIDNRANGKVYVGVHKTKDLDDGYMGSGLNIRRAIKKYGVEMFDKKYLAVFDNEKDMFNMESAIVDETFVKRKDTYNIITGGWGSFSYINDMLYGGKSKEQRKAAYMEWLNSLPEIERRKQVEHMKMVAEMGSKAVSRDRKVEIGKKMGDVFGGYNRLTDQEVERRLSIIESVDMMKYGWVKKVSEALGVTHTQSRKFIQRHYKGEYLQRKKRK